MIKALGIGDNLCDIYLDTNIMYPGGQALNVAVFSKMMGVQSEFMGAFGNDEIAAHVKYVLDIIGVGRSHCREYEGENGFARVILENGERVFKGSNKGGVLQKYPIRLTRDDIKYIVDFDFIHTSNNSYFDEQLPLIAGLPVLISYDFSHKWTEIDLVRRVCPYIDFGFLSCSDVPLNDVREICICFHNEGCKIVVATMGNRGAMLFDGINMLYNHPEPVEALDTMGAGDSFAACVLTLTVEAIKEKKERWKEATLRKSIFTKIMIHASAFAAQICKTKGAFGYGIPLPNSVSDRVLNERWW